MKSAVKLTAAYSMVNACSSPLLPSNRQSNRLLGLRGHSAPNTTVSCSMWNQIIGQEMIEKRYHYRRYLFCQRQTHKVIPMDFPYNLPIWRSDYRLISPDGKIIAEICHAGEVSMGNPTIGTLTLSNGFELERCNPSFIWSDDSRYLVVPQYFRRFGLFRRQHLIIIDVVNQQAYQSRRITCYFQPESFLNGRLITTEEPFSDAVVVQWSIPEDMNQFNVIKEVVWP